MKEIIITPYAPDPVGPYNQATRVGNTLYLSGQIAIDPASGDLVLDNIEKETHQVFNNLKAVLAKADMSFENVVKCTVFVSDMDNYGKINAVYGQYFDHNTAPARELVEVARLPKDVNIEISAIAIK